MESLLSQLPAIPDMFDGMKVIEKPNPRKEQMHSFMNRKPILDVKDKDLPLLDRLKNVPKQQKIEKELKKEHKAIQNLEDALAEL